MIIICQGTKVMISREDLKSAIDDISSYGGIKLTEKQLLVLVRKDIFLAKDIIGGLGSERENLLDKIAYDLIGEYWPTFGEGRNGKFEKFIAKVNKAAKAKGYEVR